MKRQTAHKIRDALESRVLLHLQRVPRVLCVLRFRCIPGQAQSDRSLADPRRGRERTECQLFVYEILEVFPNNLLVCSLQTPINAAKRNKVVHMEIIKLIVITRKMFVSELTS